MDNLISKKPHTRPKDVAYSSSVAREVATSTKPPTSPPLQPNIDETDLPDFTRKDIPSESPDPALTRRFQQLWVQKKEIEEDMQHALQGKDERTYRELESQHSNVNARMFFLSPRLS